MSLSYKERTDLVVRAINALGPQTERPHESDPEFVARVEAWKARGISPGYAPVLCVLEDRAERSPIVARLLERLGNQLAFGEDPQSRWLEGLARILLS